MSLYQEVVMDGFQFIRSSVQWGHYSTTLQDLQRATWRQVGVPAICLSRVFLQPRPVMLAVSTASYFHYTLCSHTG